MGVKLGLSQEHILMMFENIVLRRIIGLKSEEITEGWKKTV
jgi:hypothetical protein